MSARTTRRSAGLPARWRPCAQGREPGRHPGPQSGARAIAVEHGRARRAERKLAHPRGSRGAGRRQRRGRGGPTPEAVDNVEITRQRRRRVPRSLATGRSLTGRGRHISRQRSMSWSDKGITGCASTSARSPISAPMGVGVLVECYKNLLAIQGVGRQPAVGRRAQGSTWWTAGSTLMAEPSVDPLI